MACASDSVAWQRFIHFTTVVGIISRELNLFFPDFVVPKISITHIRPQRKPTTIAIIRPAALESFRGRCLRLKMAALESYRGRWLHLKMGALESFRGRWLRLKMAAPESFRSRWLCLKTSVVLLLILV